MAAPLMLSLQDCHDPAIAGGKATGLARLLGEGFPVPAGWCVTTTAYHRALREAGFSQRDRWRAALQRTGEDRRQALDDARSIIRQVNVSPMLDVWRAEIRRSALTAGRWAVRSSATNEDSAGASFAGLYRTELGVSFDAVDRSITEIWASLWDERVIAYAMQTGASEEPPAMAVILQPVLEAQSAGVAYSIHPVTGRSNQVTINAVRGLGALLVDGSVAPDQYVVETDAVHQPVRIRQHARSQQSARLIISAQGPTQAPLPETERNRPALTDAQLFDIARTAKRIECAFGGPVDVEWTFEAGRLWILQTRSVTAIRPSTDLTNDECEWSRANFKETLPDVPSPMGLSFLEHFMDAYILAWYRRLGCRIPPGLSAVRTRQGRPYLNVTLFYDLIGQLRGDPSMNMEQMGGEPLQSPPAVKPLGWPAYLRAGWLLWREMRRVMTSGPVWFAEMHDLAARYDRTRVRRFSLEEIGARLDELARWLDAREATFGIAAGVGQCLQVFSRLLPGWLGEDWRPLLNAALQGQGTVISAGQILRLAELTAMARADAAVSVVLRGGPPEAAAYRHRLRDTPFLAAFDRYLDDYGHRGIGESDILSPRWADQPEALLEVIAQQLDVPAVSPADIIARQQETRDRALAAIKARCGYRIDRWLIFRWWHRRLCRLFALREANRHHLMRYSTAVRTLLLQAGARLVERGLFTTPDDIFFCTLQEREVLMAGAPGGWPALVAARRAERDRCMSRQAPDTIRDWEEPENERQDLTGSEPAGLLRGIPISPGRVTGLVRLVQSPADWSRVRAGDILVAPVIDPGMAPLFGLAGGLIAEMGGTLSHGAIIAREYGLPTIANLPHAMRRLTDGEPVELRADSGEVHRIRTPGAAAES